MHCSSIYLSSKTPRKGVISLMWSVPLASNVPSSCSSGDGPPCKNQQHLHRMMRCLKSSWAIQKRHGIALLVKGYANDSQVETLFNYLMQSGSAPRFEAFIREVALRVPQHKERLMTIAECLRESGRRTGHYSGLQEGLQKGKIEGKQDEALRIAHAMLEKGIDRELVLIITGLSSDELTASSD